MSLVLPKPRSGRRLSTELEEMIRGAIQSGQLKPGQKLGSARQLAKHWKASYGAVRQSLETLAMKGLVERRPRAGTFVSSKSQAVSPRGEGRNIIGLLVPDIRMPEYSLVTRRLQDAGHSAHFEVLVSSTDNERERYDQSVIRQLKTGVGGLVLVSPQARISLETLLEIEKSGIPVVNYARVINVVQWPTVQTDTFQAVYIPIKHLCELGRKRIAFLGYPIPEAHNPQMHYGLYRAIAESGLTGSNVVEFTLPDDLYLNLVPDTQALDEMLNSWLDKNPEIDAMCCMHDHIAARVLAVLRARNVRVPEQIAVTGHGAMSEFFGLAPGELTTVDTRIDKAAEEMVRLLQIGRGSDGQQPSVVAIQPQLVIGRSTVGAKSK
jgi:DNA-binding LacI/PurR family transcriptional regulator